MDGLKRMGRPTDSPKIRKVQAKIDEDTNAMLYAYCQAKSVNESEAIRRGIKKLYEELQKE